MTLSQEDKQEIINAVLSSIRTNSKTIDQLTPVTGLSDTDFFEISGGKKVSYQVIRTLIEEILENDLDERMVNLIKRIKAEEESREAFDENISELFGSLLSDFEGVKGVTVGHTREIEQLFEISSEVAVDSIKHEQRLTALEGQWVEVADEETAERMAEEGKMESGKIYYTVEGD